MSGERAESTPGVGDARDEGSPAAPGATETGHPQHFRRTRASAAQARARIEDAQHRLEAARPRNRWIDVAFGSYEHDTHVGGGILAGAVAFRIFLFLVPYVFVFVIGLGAFATSAHESARSVARTSGVAGIAAQAMVTSSKTSFNTQVISLLIGVLALVIAARTALKTMRIVHALVWGRPLAARRTSLVAALGLIVIVTITLVMVQLVGALRSDSLLLGTIATGLFVVVPTVVWLLASLVYFPKAAEAGWLDLLPGSLLVGIGFQLLHLFTVLWITHQVESKSKTYGAIGTALALLFWAYLLGRVLTAGAVLNASNWYHDHARSAEDGGKGMDVGEPTDATP
ncbi:MAG TPA: YhjD/YihY/BrkB family envelope integrity protein [Acidimicrobiia bacterium]|jgi:uncharacterized BrkB/YihY/UPF0761 family membrane protein